MPLIYTTTQAIAQRLPGRLAIGGIGAPFGPGVADAGLIEQVGAQVEARVNARIGAVYQLPLANAQPLLASVVEKLILCELLGVYSLGDEQTTSSNQGVDHSYTGLVCKQGAAELDAIASGAVVLPGEVVLAEQRAAPVINATLTRLRAPLTDPARDIGNIRF